MNNTQSNSELASKVIDIIAESMLIAREEIFESSGFEELGIDSLGGLTIVGELEEAFDVVIPNEKALQITNVSEAISCLAEVLTHSQSSKD